MHIIFFKLIKTSYQETGKKLFYIVLTAFYLHFGINYRLFVYVFY